MPASVDRALEGAFERKCEGNEAGGYNFFFKNLTRNTHSLGG